MRRLVIAVDCDDVLVATTPFFVDAYNQRHGTKAVLAEARDAHAISWAAEPNVVVERWGELTELDGYKQLGPDPEEAMVLRELARHHELHLITARQEHERVFTRAMLDREFEGVFSSMEFVGWEGSKGEVCKRIGADVLIDDASKHLYDAIDHGLDAEGMILFGDYPWNTQDTGRPEQLVRCENWSAVKARIDTIAEQ